MRVRARERWFTEHAQCRADLPGRNRMSGGGEGERWGRGSKKGGSKSANEQPLHNRVQRRGRAGWWEMKDKIGDANVTEVERWRSGGRSWDQKSGREVQREWRKTKLTRPLTSNWELRQVNFGLSQRREAGDLEGEEMEELMEARQKWSQVGREERDTKGGSERDGVSYSDHSAPQCPARPGGELWYGQRWTSHR